MAFGGYSTAPGCRGGWLFLRYWHHWWTTLLASLEKHDLSTPVEFHFWGTKRKCSFLYLKIQPRKNWMIIVDSILYFLYHFLYHLLYYDIISWFKHQLFSPIRRCFWVATVVWSAFGRGMAAMIRRPMPAKWASLKTNRSLGLEITGGISRREKKKRTLTAGKRKMMVALPCRFSFSFRDDFQGSKR